MIRRKLTLKRVDPWSMLKFGFVVNLAILGVVMLGLFILWLVVQRLGLIDRACDSLGNLLLDLDDCGVNGGPLFRTLLFVGLLSVVVQTGIMVFGAFLYNLIADLTGGLAFTFLDESGDVQVGGSKRAGAVTTGARSTTSASSPSGTAAGVSGGASGSTSREAGAREREWSASAGPGSSPRGPTWSGGPGSTTPAAPERSTARPSSGDDDPIFNRGDEGNRSP